MQVYTYRYLWAYPLSRIMLGIVDSGKGHRGVRTGRVSINRYSFLKTMIGFIFDEQLNILPSPIRSHHFLSPAVVISVNSAVSVLTVILKQPVPSLPLFSTPHLTTVTLSLLQSSYVSNKLPLTVLYCVQSS